MQRTYDRYTGEPYDYPDDYSDEQIAADYAARRAGQQSAGRNGASAWEQIARGVGLMSNALQPGGVAVDVPPVPQYPAGSLAFAGSANVNAALDRQQRAQETSIQAQMRREQMVQEGLQQEKRLSAEIQLEEMRQKNQDRRERLAQRQAERAREDEMRQGSIHNTSRGLVHARIDPVTGQATADTIMAVPKAPIRVGNTLVDPDTLQPLYTAPGGGGRGRTPSDPAAMTPTQRAWLLGELRRLGWPEEKIAEQYPDLIPEGGTTPPPKPLGAYTEVAIRRAFMEGDLPAADAARLYSDAGMQVPNDILAAVDEEARVARVAQMDQVRGQRTGRRETGEALLAEGFSAQEVNRYLDEKGLSDDNSYWPMYHGEQWRAQPKAPAPAAPPTAAPVAAQNEFVGEDGGTYRDNGDGTATRIR